MRSTSFGLVLALLVRMASATCYSATGMALDAGHNEYMACPSSSGVSTICCGLNRTNPAGGDGSKGFTQDECLPNGLCQNRVMQNGAMGISWWLDFCTDANIASGNCLNICGAYRNSFGNTPLTPCTTGRNDSSQWCCGASNDCCTTGIGIVTLPQIFRAGLSSSSSISSSTSTASSSSSSSISSSTSASSSSASPSASSTAAAAATSKSGISGGAIAGIAIGVVAGVALLAAAIFFALRASRYKKQAAANKVDQAPMYVEAPATAYHEVGYAPREKYGHQDHVAPAAFELAQPPSELPAEDIGPFKKR